jgi:hypothetical protein
MATSLKTKTSAVLSNPHIIAQYHLNWGAMSALERPANQMMCALNVSWAESSPW